MQRVSAAGQRSQRESCSRQYGPCAAGFHSAALYGSLRGAIAPLVALLRDGEDKTRANAAGALGNLVRNSPMLCRQLVQAGALEARQLAPSWFGYRIAGGQPRAQLAHAVPAAGGGRRAASVRARSSQNLGFQGGTRKQ